MADSEPAAPPVGSVGAPVRRRNSGTRPRVRHPRTSRRTCTRMCRSGHPDLPAAGRHHSIRSKAAALTSRTSTERVTRSCRTGNRLSCHRGPWRAARPAAHSTFGRSQCRSARRWQSATRLSRSWRILRPCRPPATGVRNPECRVRRGLEFIEQRLLSATRRYSEPIDPYRTPTSDDLGGRDQRRTRLLRTQPAVVFVAKR